MKIFQTAIVFISILIAIDQSIADSGQSEISLDTITVTANKQEENIQDVPMSITAFDEFALEDKNITSVRDLTDYVPNLILIHDGATAYARPVMRGIVAEVGSDVSTAMFIDGIPVLSPNGYENPLQDIERVEVLRGPQGTLYGKNATAGAINIITRQPDNDFRGKVSVDGGEDYKKEVAFNLSGPIIQDNLYFGVSGQYYDKDGFIKNGHTGGEANDQAHWYGKGQLRWAPIDDLNISFIFSQIQYDNGGDNIGLSEDGAASMGMTASGDREVYSDLDTYNKAKISAQALKVSYNFSEALNLTSITTHRLYEDDQAIDFDFNPVAILPSTSDNEEDKISQELRLSSNTEKMTWVAGIYYDKDDNMADLTYGPSYALNRDLGGEAYAIYGQLRYALTPKIGLTGGLRYETQDKDMQDHATGNSFDDTWDDIAPKFSVDYAITEQVMGYATVAKGFRSGGFNAMSNDSAYDSYDSEELWSYEIGAKSQLLENRLIVNGALFYMDIDDMQVNESLAFGRYITNAGTAVSYGAELEVLAKITPRFTMTANAGYTNAEFDEYQDAAGDYSDNKAPNVPEYTFAIGGQYRAGNGFYANVDWVCVGKTYLERTNTYERDAYQLINAKVGYEAENWDIYLYGKNIFDEDYSSQTSNYVYYSDPREIGVKLTYRL
ncbi:TonB-dependent receptor domain-containing protein [uncultured Desulfobacter sp.]|uniref:TonB-dependent receptor n=1 Tax=uncultured Desulfobacter sp. TaxID=240139 RepID=UPI002AA68701|nr:TonB-dependent receptor [uncultured Desulfobacter sp.]